MSKTLSEVDLNYISSIVYLDVIEDGILREEGDPKISKLAEIYNGTGQVDLGTVIDYYLGKGQFEGLTEGPDKLAERFSSKPGSFGDMTELDYWVQFLEELDTSTQKDYRSWKIKEIENDNLPIDFKENGDNTGFTGFVAYTIEVEEGVNVVSFRGSEPILKERYVDDWIADLSFFYADLNDQEKKAQAYIQRLEEEGVAVDYITGHSLGGHLALFAAMTLSEEQQEQLKKCISFAAPGFNQDVLDRYRDVIAKLDKEGKMKEIQNEMDPTGNILFNPTVPEICSSNNPDAGNIVNHSNFFMKLLLDENGNLVFEKSPTQQKHFLCDIVNMLTVAGEILPPSWKEKLIEAVIPILQEVTINAEADEEYFEKLKDRIIGEAKIYMQEMVDFLKRNPVLIPQLPQIMGISILIGTIAALKVFQDLSLIAALTAAVNQCINDSKAFAAKIKPYLEEIKQNMIYMKETLEKEIVAAYEGIKEVIAEIGTNIQEDLERLKDTFDKVNETIIECVNQQIEYVSGIGEKIGNATKETLENISKIMNEVEAPSELGIMGEILKLEIGKKIFEAEMKVRLDEIGSQIKEDINDGFENAVNFINEGATALGEAIVEGVENAIGVEKVIQGRQDTTHSGMKLYKDKKLSFQGNGVGAYSGGTGSIEVDTSGFIRMKSGIDDIRKELNRYIENALRASNSAVSLASRETEKSYVRKQVQTVKNDVAQLKKIQRELGEELSDLSEGVRKAKSMYEQSEKEVMGKLKMR